MNKIYIIKKNRNLLMSASILAAFIIMFYLISNIYMLSSRRSQTIILKDNLQNSPASDRKLNVSNTIKLDIPYYMQGLQVINNDSLAFTTYTGDTSSLSIINIKDNKLTEIDKSKESSLGGLTVSRNGEQLIYTDFGTDGTNGKTYYYDIRNKTVKDILDNSSYTNKLLSSDKYIGATPDYLFLTDLNTNKRVNLIDIKDLNISLDAAKNRPLKMVFNFTVSTDEKTLYFQPLLKRTTDISIIFTLNIENKELSKYTVDGILYDIQPLDNNNLLICGNINKINGLFIYNMDSKSYKTLIHGAIYDIDISSDRKKVAYTVQNENKSTELYTALLNGNSVESNTMLLSDTKYISFFEWSKDSLNLFSVSEGLGGSTIYRFAF